MWPAVMPDARMFRSWPSAMSGRIAANGLAVKPRMGGVYYVDDAGHELPTPPATYGVSRYSCYGTICLATYTASP